MNESERLRVLERHVRELERVVSKFIFDRDFRELEQILGEITGPSSLLEDYKTRPRRTRKSRKPRSRSGSRSAVG